MFVMQRGQNFILIFFVLLSLSILLLVLNVQFLSPVTGFLSKATHNIFLSLPFFGPTDQEKKLKEENLRLSGKIVSDQKLLSENKALRDQFLVAFPKSFDLLPSRVIGSPRFLPGVTLPEIFILDVGKKDGVKMGNAVVFKDNLVGRISKVAETLSEVTLVINPDFKLAAKTSSGVLGIVKGQGNGDLILDNVLLSDTLDKDGLILTSGDLQTDQSGLPSGIIIGKIESVEKAPSELFQRARLESMLEFSRMQNVFVVVGIK